jgi:hypothetical protein
LKFLLFNLFSFTIPLPPPFLLTSIPPLHSPHRTEFSNAQLIAIAARIKMSGGVVVAEELAPYLDPPDLKLAPRNYDGTAGNYDSYVVRF